jgi:hypothetical protein
MPALSARQNPRARGKFVLDGRQKKNNKKQKKRSDRMIVFYS